MSETEVTVDSRLAELGVDATVIEKIKTELGATSVDDLAHVSEDDLTKVGLKPLQARKIAAALKPAPAAAASFSTVSFDGVLPDVPSDDSWLTALRTGGVLKVDQSTVISAVRAALAHRAGLYEIPARLVELMERFADENDEPVPPEFFQMRKQLIRRNYAEIFEAIEGLDGSFVTEGRKKQLFTRVDGELWPKIVGFQDQLKSWQEAWMQGTANPAVMMSVILNASSGGLGVMPPGMMAPPDTGVLRDYADSVADAINRVFAGTGVQIAAALAFEATRIRDILMRPGLPAMIGATNRDQMLKMLGVDVPATYTRLETNLTRYVLAVMQVKDQPAGNEELRYFGTLYMLGSQIPWGELNPGNSVGSGHGVTGVGSTRRPSASRPAY